MKIIDEYYCPESRNYNIALDTDQWDGPKVWRSYDPSLLAPDDCVSMKEGHFICEHILHPGTDSEVLIKTRVSIDCGVSELSDEEKLYRLGLINRYQLARKPLRPVYAQSGLEALRKCKALSDGLLLSSRRSREPYKQWSMKEPISHHPAELLEKIE